MKLKSFCSLAICMLLSMQWQTSAQAAQVNDSLQVEIDIPDKQASGSIITHATLPVATLFATPLVIDENTATSVVTVTLSQPAATNVSVNLSSSGTFTRGTDTNFYSQSLFFSSGTSTRSTTIQTVQDDLVEGNETIIIDISSLSGATENGVQQQTITITDDDTAGVSLTASSATVAEAAGAVTLTATLDKVSYETVTVNLGFSGTATSGTDYTLSGSAINIAAGQLTGSVTVTATSDTSVELDETIIVDIASVSGGSALETGVQQQTISLTDDDVPGVQLLTDVTALTETSGGNIATLTAQLDKPSYEDVTVNLGLSGTATSGSDYAMANSVLTISAGSTTATTTVTVSDDTTAEASETIVVDVTSVSGGKAVETGTAQQTLTITDNDQPRVSLTASSSSVSETSGSDSVMMSAVLDRATFENVSITIGFSGTASNGTDYLGFNNVTIPAGQTNIAFEIRAIDDALVEGAETIIAEITAVAGGNAIENNTQSQTITLLDDETPLVTLSTSAATLGESGSSVTLIATLAQATFEPVTVNLAFSGSATLATDYSTSGSVITIATGQTTGSVTLTAITDTNAEQDETIIVDVTSVSGGSAQEAGTQQQTITLTDDDVPNVQLVADVTSLSEASVATVTTLTVQMDKPSFEDVIVDLGASGTGTSGADYVLANSRLTIVAGTTSASTQLSIVDDNVVEANENVIVDITSVSGGKAVESGVAQQTISLIDNEQVLVSLVAQANTVSELSSNNRVMLTAQLDKTSYQDINVTLALSGSAINSTDYSIAATNLTIPAGSNAISVELMVIDDALVEGVETIVVDIANVVGGNAVEHGVQSQTLSIEDDETRFVALSASSTTLAEESGQVTLTATLEQTTFEAVTVGLSFSGEATNNQDYTVSNASIVIPAGQLSASVSVAATQDATVEPSESIVVDIASVTGGNAQENGVQQQTLSLTDDDNAAVSLSVNQTSVSEGGGNVTVTVTLDQPSFEAVKVTLAANGTATDGSDFNLNQEVITIAAGQTSGSTDILIIDDSQLEDTETIVVEIASVMGGKAVENGVQSQTVTVSDNDVIALTIAIDKSTVSENGDVAVITASLAGVSAEHASVSFDLYGLALKGSDYLISSETITIPAGQLTGSATITTVEDNIIESSEIIALSVTEVVGQRVVLQQATLPSLMIEDNDSVAVSLTVDSAIMTEDDGVNAIVATIEQAAAANVSVNLSYSGSATLGDDYTNAVSKVVIEPGETSKSIVLAAKQDTAKESDETIVVTIDSITGVNTTTGSNNEQTITINDDDQVGPADYGISINVADVNKLNQQQFGFTLNNAPSNTSYAYVVSDSLNQLVEGQGKVTTTEQVIDGIDVSMLEDGLLTVSLRLTDSEGIVGSPAVDTVNKNVIAPVVLALHPQHQAVIEQLQPQLELTFDGLIYAGSSDNAIEVRRLDNDQVLMSVNSDSEAVVIKGGDVSITLPSALTDYTSYYVMIAKGAFYDFDGNPVERFGDNSGWQFSVTNPQLVTVADAVVTSAGQAVDITVLANDSSGDSELDSTSVAIKTHALHGVVTVEAKTGVVTYTPAADFSGKDRFWYQVKDAKGAMSLPTRVDIVVNAAALK